MRYAQHYLSGIRRSITRLLPSPSPLLAERARSDLLKALTCGPASNGADASRATAYFCARTPVATFLTVGEARRAAADYASNKVRWRQQVLTDAQGICDVGLPIYGRLAGPLRGGLDWTTLPKGPHGDRLYRLRPHRFGFLPRLALAASIGGDFLPALHATLARWCRHVESVEGAEEAYYSNLVIIYRLLAISWAAPFTAAKAEEGDATAARLCLQLFTILAADCRQLGPRLGQSAPNNHRLADSFAAWFLAACYPELALPVGEPVALEEVWLAELGRQFQEDGTNFEQSQHYHELGCELALAWLVMALRRGGPLSDAALERVAAMLRFQAALADREGNGFALGDATDDPLLPLDGGGSWALGAWRLLYRALFDPAFASTAETAPGAEKAHWLLAAVQGVRLPLLRPAEPLRQLAVFPLGGYLCFREGEDEDCLLFRSGPRPGAAVFPGHAMSNLLSVYWNSGGRPVLEPAGTYSYAVDGLPAEGGPSHPRAYFRGPAAHNGPVLPGHDPLGHSQGRFRNYDSGARVVTAWRSLDKVMAWAEARLQEPGPLSGWRRGVLRLPGRYTLIYDRIPPLPAEADLACHWQFAPEAAVTLHPGRRALAELPSLSVYLGASEGVEAMSCVCGQPLPPAGWVSRRYGQVQAAPQLICRVSPQSKAVAFLIGRRHGEEAPAVEVAVAGEEGLAVTLRQGDTSVVCLFGRFSGRIEHIPAHLDFDGDALWLAFAGDSCRELRTLGLRRFASSCLGLELTAAEPQQPQSGWLCLEAAPAAAGLSGRWMKEDRGPPGGGQGSGDCVT